MRRSPPASNQLPALAERKRRHAELTPAAADAAGAGADADAVTDLHVWTELPCVPEVPLCTAVISPVSVVSASVRAPPRLVTLES